MKKLTAVFLGIIVSYSSFAQMGNVTGEVRDGNEDKPIKNAVVALLTPKDSILYSFTRADSSGKYILKNVPFGNYILMTSHPYYADILNNISVNGDNKIPLTKLVSKSELLQNIIIKSGSPLRIRGDTTVYTADSFKVSANANVEELLKKLPGIE